MLGFLSYSRLALECTHFDVQELVFVSYPHFYIVVSIPLSWQAFHFVNSKAGWSSHPSTVPGMVLSAGGLAQYLGGGWSSCTPPHPTRSSGTHGIPCLLPSGPQAPGSCSVPVPLHS